MEGIVNAQKSTYITKSPSCRYSKSRDQKILNSKGSRELMKFDFHPPKFKKEHGEFTIQAQFAITQFR